MVRTRGQKAALSQKNRATRMKNVKIVIIREDFEVSFVFCILDSKVLTFKNKCSFQFIERSGGRVMRVESKHNNKYTRPASAKPESYEAGGSHESEHTAVSV